MAIAGSADPARNRDRTIYVAGAGIAGLTLALALGKFGFTVIVLERAPGPQEIGAGIQIAPNARYILDLLGVGPEIDRAGFEPETLDIYPFGHTRPINRLKFGESVRQRYGAPYSVMHRADLAKVLLQAAKRQPNVDVYFGCGEPDVVRHQRGISVNVHLSDQSIRTVRPYAFIGADGVASSTRTRLLEGPAPIYSGLVAWRALLPAHELADLIGSNTTSVMFGPGMHAVFYPMKGRQRFNVAMFAKVPRGQLSGPRKPPRPSLDRYYVKRSALVSRLFDVVGEDWTFWPLHQVRTKSWHSGPVGLIGDAAHAMLPFQAQGAAMAIEDAALLAAEMDTADSPEKAFARFAALRTGRVEKVRRLSARNGSIFHLPGPFCYARDFAIARTDPTDHFKRLDWLYGYDPFDVTKRRDASDSRI